MQSWADRCGVEKILLQLEYKEFKANVFIHASLRMSNSVQEYVLLKMPYLEQYRYTKLGRSIQGKENLTTVGVHRSPGKCGYPCLTPTALLRIAVCSARDALLGKISIYEAGKICVGQRIQARKYGYSEYGIRSRTCGYTELSEVRHIYSKCSTPNIGSIRSPASYKIFLRLEYWEII